MENQQNLFDLQVDSEVTDYLSQSARWAKFVAIVGFVFCGLFVLFAFFAGTILASMSVASGGTSPVPAGFLTVFYLVIALVMILPYYYQYKFATGMQAALRSGDQESFLKSMSGLKSYFKFMGILCVIGLAIMVLCFIFGIIGGIMAASM